MFIGLDLGTSGLKAIVIDDAQTILAEAVAPLDDAPTRAAVLAERALLRHLRGGCLAPIGAWGRVDGDRLHLTAVVLSADGAERLDANDSVPITAAEELGQRIGRRRQP